MKNLFIKTLLSVIILFSLSNCKKDDDSDKETKAIITCKVKLVGSNIYELREGVKVQFGRDGHGVEETKYTDREGKVTFYNLLEDDYDMECWYRYDGEYYFKDAYFHINNNETKKVTVKLDQINY